MNLVPPNPALTLLLLFLVISPLSAATILWDGGGDGTSFSDPANWAGDAVPGGADHAVIGLDGTYTVRLTSDISIAGLTLGGTNGRQTLDASGFKLVLGTDSSTIGANGLLMVGGVLSGGYNVLTIDAPLLVRGALEWTNGMIYAATYYLPPNGRVITVAPGGVMRWLGPAERRLSATLENQGTLRWEDGPTWFEQGYAHSSSGEFEIALVAPATFGRAGTNSVGPWVFTNTGTIRKTGGDTARLQIELRTIGGVVDVREGTLLQNYTSRWERTTVAVAAGALLQLSANRTHEIHTVADTLSGTIDGTFLVSGLPGQFHTTIHADTVVGGVLNILGTGIQLDYAELGGEFDISDYSFSPAPVNQGLMRVFGDREKVISGAFVNKGTLRWEEGRLVYYRTASFTNEGTFEMVRDTATMEFIAGGINGTRPGPFFNTGTVIKMGKGRVNSLVDFYTIGGLVDVRGGLLVQGSTSRWEDARITIDSGASLRLDANGNSPHVIAGTLRSDPLGDLLVSGIEYGYQTTMVADTVRGGRLEIGGTGMQLGDIQLGITNGPLPPVNGGLLRFVGGDEQFVVGNFRNEGNLRWEKGNLRIGVGITVTNAGLFELAADGGTYYGDGFAGVSTLLNDTAGTMRKTGAGQATLRATVMNQGLLAVGSGILLVENTFNNLSTFTSTAQGIISGRGTLNVSPLEWPAPGRIINAGTVAPGPGDAGEGLGTLRVHGALPLARLEFELAGTDSALYDRLIVSGTTPPDLAAVTAYVNVANGFVPRTGDWFDVVSGAIANELLDVVQTGNTTVQLLDTYPGNGVRLVVGDVVAGEMMIDVIAPALSARQGETVDLPITVVATEAARSKGATEVTVTLRFNSTLLGPIGSTPRGQIEGGERILGLRIPLDPSRDTTRHLLRMMAALGNDSTTSLAITDAASNGAGVPVRAQDGLFRLLDLCYEGGPRLINPDGVVAMSKVRPNPVSDRITFDLNLTELGATRITLVDLNGTVVQTFVDRELPRGRHTVDLDTRRIPSGGYFLVVTTPTMKFSEQVEVVR